MIIDNYTKFIMTVIAGALVVIALEGTGIIATAYAQADESWSRLFDFKNKIHIARWKIELLVDKLVAI